MRPTCASTSWCARGAAILSIDLGGGALHRRGWRQSQGEAPLKENLAAAMLMRGGWPKIHAEGGALLDPMCGSGTLLIEGALMVADVAPGLLRWQGVAADALAGFRRKALAGAAARKREQRAQAGRAALAAGVLRRRHRSACAPCGAGQRRSGRARQSDPPRPQAHQCAGGPAVRTRGLVVCNPPYDAAPRRRCRLVPRARRCAARAPCRVGARACCAATPNWRSPPACARRRSTRCSTARSNAPCWCAIRSSRPRAKPRHRAAPAPLSEGAQMVANRLRKNLEAPQDLAERERDRLLSRLRRRPAGVFGGGRRLPGSRWPAAAVPARAGICRARRPFPRPTRAAASANCWPRCARCSRVPREQIVLKTRGARQGRQQVRPNGPCAANSSSSPRARPGCG